ncbi:MAG: gliding motility-associated C-terminal domain-containing protein [Phaeodactylibacter sp.]|nr:gliding motility-associated C-terminal domain-containing protein [Phaeodactylibacter sp.]
MRVFLTILSLFVMAASLLAQPVNDNCDGVIGLGVLPACPDDIFTNVGATASNIGFGNIPACFNGGSVARDVWFAFTTNDTLIDISIILQGTDQGANGPITNPQIAIYRGDCSFNNLADLGFCVSAPAGSNQLQLDVLGLTPNTTYYIRINDYSASATPNSGDFTLCIEEYIPAINIGDQPSTTSCFGTLYDSGGPDGDYSNSENLTFTISPAEFHQCIEITIVDLMTENNFDFLRVYAGNSTSAPLIASLTGTSTGDTYTIQASSSSVTLQFTSDFSAVGAGFEITWECSPLDCDGSSIDNPTVITGLPFNQGGYSTCGAAATFSESPCGSTPFLNGPEYVFAYQTQGGFCAQLQVTNAESGTGILVLDGPPDAPGTNCLGTSPSGILYGVNFDNPGTYYIVVAQANGCTDFGLSITEDECNLNPSLSGALCNPLNGCIDPSGLPSVFNFNQGFQDIQFNPGVNDGCWVNTGSAQPNYYWFTIEAQAAGPFGFIVQAANPGEDSDIDFNVWGPFDSEQVCEDPQAIINYINTHQPVRSSWAGGADPTGLAQVNAAGEPVTDAYDCAPVPGANGDDFASVINCQPGQVYAVLINDWGNDIESGAISVDWSPSAYDVLAPIPTVVVSNDTAICSGESVQLLIESSIDNITWLKDTSTLSCLTCLDPIATPLESTIYVGVVDAVCYKDTVEVLVQVYDVDAGPDVTVCLNEEIQIVAGSNFLNATYTWDAPAGVSLSCTDCAAPLIVAEQPGVYNLSVTLQGPSCTLADGMQLTVLPQTAAQYNISDDQQICQGETANVGGAAVPGVSYGWTSNPPGFASSEANPPVMPDTTTVYYISANNGQCPVPSLDSVLVVVDIPPVIQITGDTAVCQEEPIVLGHTAVEPGVTYTWSGPSTIEDVTDPNSIAFPESEGAYTLTAVRGACTVTESFNVSITEIAIDILDANMGLVPDTLRICRGEEVNLFSSIVPTDSTTLWTGTDPGFPGALAPSITVMPQSVATYYAQVAVPGCFKIDSVVVLVDSLPYNMEIMPADTTICQGELLVMTSQIYDPADFPDVYFQWIEGLGFQTPDTLYNMVITGQDTIRYARFARNGVCVDTSFAQVNVIKTDQITIVPQDTLVCAGQPVLLDLQLGFEPTEIEWMSSPQGALSCTDCEDPVATPTANTLYTVQAKVENCPASAQATIRVSQPPTLGVVPFLQICLGDSVSLNSAFDQFSLYEWTSTDPVFGVVNDPAPNVSPTETQTYTVVADNGICPPVEAQTTVEVIGQVDLSVTPSVDFICVGDEVTITAQADSGSSGDTFTWQGSDGSQQTGNTIVVSPDATTTYSLTYISGAGCEVLTDEVTIEVEDGVILQEIGMEMDSTVATLFLGDMVTLSTEYISSLENLVLEWYRNDSLITSGVDLTVLEETLLLSGDITYTVRIETPAGCIYEVSKTITVESPIIDVPNAFTPNGDDTNETFDIVYQGRRDAITITEFKVFNRWGQLVYDNDTPDTGWDGAFNGTAQPSDVYFYIISYRLLNGFEPKPLKGDVSLLR